MDVEGGKDPARRAAPFPIMIVITIIIMLLLLIIITNIMAIMIITLTLMLSTINKHTSKRDTNNDTVNNNIC